MFQVKILYGFTERKHTITADRLIKYTGLISLLFK
jgi:hypothetical protein